jgi:hypothetical protein
MKIRLTARGMELSAELKQEVVRRVHFTLGRFGGKIKSLSIRLAHASAAGDGPEKCCFVRADTCRDQRIVVRETQETVSAAVALAMERTERAVERQLILARQVEQRSRQRSDFQFGD